MNGHRRRSLGRGATPDARTPALVVAAMVLSILLNVVGGVRTAVAPGSRQQAGNFNAATRPGGAGAHGPLNVYAATMRGLDPKVAGIKPYVYVPNSDGGTLTIIDPETLQVVRRIPAGWIPHHVAPSWDLSRLYVDEEHSGTLMVIDPSNASPEGTVRVPDPYNLYFTPDGSTAIVVEEAFRRLEFRDPVTWTLRSTASLGPGLDHLDFSADGSFFLITAEWSGEVFKVDSHTGRLLQMVDVGGLPIDVRLSPDGTAFFVANQGRMGVSVLDAVTLKELRFIPTGRGAHGLYISRDTRSLYVSDRLEGTVSVIDIASGTLTARWNVGGSPDMLQLNPDGTQLWMSSRYDGYVIVVDTRTGAVLARIYSGAGAHGLTYFPAPGAHSLGHNGVYR